MPLSARSLTVAVALTAAFGPATLAQARPPVRAVRRVVDSLAHAYIDAQRSPAVSIEILRGRDTIVRAGYGFADLEQQVGAAPSTLYQIGSITKQFAAAAVMRLVEAGRINLDDSISGYISGLPTDWRPAGGRPARSPTPRLPT